MDVGTVFIAFLIGLGLLLLGLPIAVVMLVMGTAGGMIAYGFPFFESIGNVLWGVQNNNILTCVPLFILMGELLLRTGIADSMYKGLSVLMTGLPGGLLQIRRWDRRCNFGGRLILGSPTAPGNGLGRSRIALPGEDDVLENGRPPPRIGPETIRSCYPR